MHGHEYLCVYMYLCNYSIVPSVVRVTVYSWTQALCVASEHYYVKAENFQANERRLSSANLSNHRAKVPCTIN